MALEMDARPTAPSEAFAGTNPTKRNYARIIEQTWIWSIVGYSVLRFFIAWGAFSDHGANPWIFGIIDVATAWPYAKAVAVVCKRSANNDWSRLPVPVGVALTTFFAPYAYLWFAAGEMPGGLRLGMALCVGMLLLAATAGVIAKTRKLRKQAVAAPSSNVDPRDTEILIDLTGEHATIERRPQQAR